MRSPVVLSLGIACVLLTIVPGCSSIDTSYDLGATGAGASSQGKSQASLEGEPATSSAWPPGQPVANASTTEEVLAKLGRRDAEITTLECDIQMIFIKRLEGDLQRIQRIFESRTTVTSHYITETIKREGKVVGHLTNTTSETRIHAQGTTTRALMICDGEFWWCETRDPRTAQVTVMKSKDNLLSGQSLMGQTPDPRARADMKLVGEENLDGQKMWVLRSTPAHNPQVDWMILYFGQNDLVCHRMTLYRWGEETREVRRGNVVEQRRTIVPQVAGDLLFTNIKINGPVDRSAFKYTPPRGAKVVDMTQGMRPIEGPGK